MEVITHAKMKGFCSLRKWLITPPNGVGVSKMSLNGNPRSAHTRAAGVFCLREFVTGVCGFLGG